MTFPTHLCGELLVDHDVTNQPLLQLSQYLNWAMKKNPSCLVFFLGDDIYNPQLYGDYE